MADGVEPTPSTSGLSKTTSVIWKHFRRLSNSEAKCNYCGALMKTPTGATTSLKRHIEVKHTTVFKDLLNEIKNSEELKKQRENLKFPTGPKQAKIDCMFKSNEQWTPSHPKAIALTNAIGTWMAKSFHPYSLVEEEGFRTVMKIAEPKYNIPSRTTFSSTVIPQLYENVKTSALSQLKTDFQEGVMSMSVTTDLWSSSANDAFICVTGHYVNKEFLAKTLCLENNYFPEEHTGIQIEKRLKEVLKRWNISQTKTMPIFVVTDNATNMVSAIRLSEFHHLRCFAHTLQLALNDTKKEVNGMSGMLSKARAIVGHYKHSPAAQLRLNKIQEQLGKQPLQVIQDCETRWNSEFKMLARLHELKKALSVELVTSKKPENLNLTEWELVQGYINILKPLDDATTMASSAFLPTLSSVLPLINGIKSVLKKYILSGGKGIMLARALDKAISARFPNEQYTMNRTYILAMVVDPRYKLIILDNVQKKLATDMLFDEATSLNKETKEKDANRSPPAWTSVEATDDVEQEEEELESTNISLWQNFEALSKEAKEVQSIENPVSVQVQSYLSAPTIPLQGNPYDWWRANIQTYSLVGNVARRYLGIPATEVASERIFSSAGNIVNERRRSLTQDHMSELVFLHHNVK